MPAPPRPPRDAHAEIRALRAQVEALLRMRTILPYLPADPTVLVNGMAWVRADTNQLCYVSNGVVRRLTGA